MYCILPTHNWNTNWQIHWCKILFFLSPKIAISLLVWQSSVVWMLVFMRILNGYFVSSTMIGFANTFCSDWLHIFVCHLSGKNFQNDWVPIFIYSSYFYLSELAIIHRCSSLNKNVFFKGQPCREHSTKWVQPPTGICVLKWIYL
jgi:hypothetical protein